MAKKISIDEILCFRPDKAFSQIFLSNKPGESFDEHNTFLVYEVIDLYGAPVTKIPVKNTATNIDKEEDGDSFSEIDYENLTNIVKLGKIKGTMIMVKELIESGYSVFGTCDDEDADLGYVISSLQDNKCPLNEKTGDPYQNIFYIHEIEYEERNVNKTIKKRIMNELQYIILKEYHVRPDILAYIAAPTGDDWKSDLEKAEDLEAATRVMENMNTYIENMLHQDDQPYQPPIHPFSEKDLAITLGRRTPNEPSGLPLDHKNFEIIEFYVKHGFTEIPNSQLLYRELKW